MKKIYLMLISFLCLAFSAQAAVVTDLSQLSNDKLYTIRSERAFLMYSSSCPTKIAASTGKNVGTVERNPQNPDQQFKIEYENGKYYLYSVGAGKYVGAAGLYNANKVVALNISASGGTTYRWKLLLGALGMNTQEPGTDWAEGIVVDSWTTTDAGNCYIIEEVTDGEGGGDTTSEEIYDFAGFGDENLLNLFYNAIKQGRNYPTKEEFEMAGIQQSDIAFIRSHVRRANIMSREDRLVPGTYQERDLWMNIPMDYGKDAAVGHPEAKFNADVYSMWQYTNLFGTWNHSLFQAPGAWVDAAHRNGTDIMSGIKFFESWTAGSGDGPWASLIKTKDANGYKYVKPLIHILMYFGSDGINYNWEDASWSNSEIIQFHKELYKYAAQMGFDNYHSGLYTQISDLTASDADARFGTTNNGKTHDLMLNYSNGDFSYQMGSSVQAAEAAMGTSKGLYAGVWIATMDRGWNRLDADDATRRCGICLWGEHDQSRFYSFNEGDGVYDIQGNYQRLLERGFSGGNRNPATRPAASANGNNWKAENGKLPLQTFAGLASWIPERSTIQGNLPFGTHFTLGNGDRYYYKGKKSHAGAWYNMGSQDIVPTYRWLRYKSNTTNVSNEIDVNYTHLDAYTGGSCIELTGAATSTGTDIILYKTALKAGNGAYAKVAVKTLKNVKATDLYLILKVRGSNTWQEYAVGNVSGNTWEEKRFDLTGIANGNVIERIGLRVKGNNNDYQLYVGKLEINDNNWSAPAAVKDVVAEVKQETKSSMGIKLYWNVDATAKTRSAFDLVYNDEANISHFEIMYKVGEDGKVSQVGTTSQWATFIGNIEFESVNDAPFIGVRSVSTDLKTYSPIVWVEVPRGNQADLPEKKAEDTYGISQIDPASAGIENARAQRYVELAKTTGATQNLNYTASGPVADGTQYTHPEGHLLKVEQGQNITMTIKGPETGDGLQYCYAGGWLDLNGSGDFDHPMPVERTAAEIEKGTTETDPEGERIFFIGKHEGATPELVTGYTFTFKIPEDATPGDSRLRIVFSDAWFAGAFNPTGLTNKGFTIDFDVDIDGLNPGRAAVDTRDQGEAEEPESLNTTDVEEVVDGKVSTAEGVEGAIVIDNADKAWIYTADGKLVEFVKNPAQVAVEEGVYLVKMQLGNVIRSTKVLVK